MFRVLGTAKNASIPFHSAHCGLDSMPSRWNVFCSAAEELVPFTPGGDSARQGSLSLARG